MEAGTVVLPRSGASPFRSAARRLLVALGVLLAIATVVWLDREGYSDVDDDVTWFDGLYYATVTASTTGYGDIAPLTDRARLTNVLVVTPLRVVFVVALVGSVFEVVTTAARHLFRERAYRRALSGHVVVIGYGTRGRSAIRTMVDGGVDRASIVVIDPSEAAVDEAVRNGLAAVQGDGTRNGVQKSARVRLAAQVVVAVGEDATSVLATLTARRLAPEARIVSSVRALENAPLLHQSGADSVVVSSETAGRLLGVAVSHPPAATVLGDLLTPGRDLGLRERPVEPAEVGHLPRDADGLVLAVLRDGRRHTYYDDTVGQLQEGDVLVVVEHHGH